MCLLLFLSSIGMYGYGLHCVYLFLDEFYSPFEIVKWIPTLILFNNLIGFLQIMRNASKTLIPVTLELGGKDAFIVCNDVDVERV